MSRNSREAIINGDSVYLTKLAKKWFLCDLNAIIQYMINLNVCPDTRRRNECWRQLSCVAHDMPHRYDSRVWSGSIAGRCYREPCVAFLINAQISKIVDVGFGPTTNEEVWLGDLYGWTHEEVRIAVADEILFALVVFYTDGFLTLNGTGNTQRFFEIASRLPLELQMVLCSRALGSAKNVITSAMSEPAFRALAALY